MAKKCRKCGYERQPTDTGQATECPACGAIYAKVDAFLARQAAEERRNQAMQGKEERKKKEMAEKSAAYKATQERKGKRSSRTRHDDQFLVANHVSGADFSRRSRKISIFYQNRRNFLFLLSIPPVLR